MIKQPVNTNVLRLLVTTLHFPTFRFLLCTECQFARHCLLILNLFQDVAVQVVELEPEPVASHHNFDNWKTTPFSNKMFEISHEDERVQLILLH